MKKNLLIIAAIASATLVSCSSDEFGGEENYPIPVQDAPIAFGSYFKAMTRADLTGAEAAEKLGNKFVVSGKKGSTTAATDGNIVFDNYLVEYAENTANTTESNSANWEYVGKGRIQHAIDHGITSQTIKYWDYSKAQYDFIAWSTGSKDAVYSANDLADGKVYVSSINPNATATAAYTFTGKAADLSECYIADLVTVKKAQYGDDPVKFRFRQLGTKVRIGIYETVPGYSVKDVKFYSAAAVDLVKTGDAKPESGTYSAEEAAKKNTSAKIFTTSANEIFTEGTYTITFPTVDTPTSENNNQAHVTFTPKDGATQSTIVDWGGLNYTIAEEGEKTEGAVFLGRTSNTASFAGDAANNYYEIYMPNQTGTNLNLRVDYTLESIDGSGEIINVRGATAQVPLIYTQWKPGYAYTYLFKISDKTNGYTGAYDPTQPDNTTINSEPAGLYPITFDAVVVNAEEDATQETITTVSTPSITTYQKGSTVVNANEYLAATGKIFVTVNDGNAGTTPDLANGALQTLTGKAALYTLPTTLPDGIIGTEAEVIDALSMREDVLPDGAAQGTIKGRSGLVLTPANFDLTNKIEYGADGNTINIETDQAMSFTAAGAGTYAFVYTKTASTGTTKKYQPVTKAANASVKGFYRYKLVAATDGDVQEGVKYFENEDASTGMITAFLGQGVSNLYLNAQGTTIASGYAETGTTYYYSYMDGQTKKYKAAHEVKYEDFGTTTLYTDAACTTPKQETTPANGQAYYYKDDSTGETSYCVIYPQQTTNLYVIAAENPNDASANKVACGDSDEAVNGMTYFDMYTQNDGVRYAKVIKVQ